MIGQTPEIENTLNPVWATKVNSVFFDYSEVLRLEFFDYNPVTKDRPLGTTEIRIDDIFAIEDLDVLVSNFDEPESIKSIAPVELENSKEIREDSDIQQRTSVPSPERLVPAANTLKHVETMTEAELERKQAFEKLKEDGLLVERISATKADVWLPIYIPGKDKGSFKVKGSVHFFIECLPVIPSRSLRAEKKNAEAAVVIEPVSTEAQDQAEILEQAEISRKLSIINDFRIFKLT